MIKRALFMHLTLLNFFVLQCSEDSNNNSDNQVITISGRVIDAVSGLPVSGAAVSFIEKDSVMLTNEQGMFTLTTMESYAKNSQDFIFTPDINVTVDMVSPAVSVMHDGFWSREINVSPDSTNTIAIVPLTYDSYRYYKPVQLEDGLSTSSIDESSLNAENIQQLMDKFIKNGFREIHSILVYKNQNLALEQYFYGNNDTIQFENNILRDTSPAHIWWKRTDKHYVASVNKSLTSTIVGMALSAYGKSVNDPIATFLPDYETYFSDTNKAAVTIRHALTMTMGFHWDEWGSNDLSLLWKTNNFSEFLLSRDNMGVESEWRYNSASPNMLLNCMNNLVDGTIRDWADQKFYKKLGITDYLWQEQPGELPEGAARMYLRPRDMLKIGVTYLNNGIWNGEQVISPDWVNAVALDQVDIGNVNDYSYFFWLRSVSGVDYYAAEGDGGNYIIIIPSLNMVVVMTGGNYLNYSLYQNQMTAILKDYLIPAAF